MASPPAPDERVPVLVPVGGRALHRAKEVDPVDGGATLIGRGERFSGRRLRGAEDETRRAAPAIIDLLPSPLRLGAGRLHEPLAWVALAGLRSHLVEANDDAVDRWRGVELLNRPLLRAKSGSTRSPNQVSSRRHLRPSWMKISLSRLRRMAMPRSPR